MELDIIIVGAGLAGLAAANGLRRAGHRVRLFEKSSFSRDLGAGITVAPNAVRVLKKWDFDFQRAKAVITQGLQIRDGKTGELLAGWLLPKLGAGADVFNMYRPDYHAELWRLAVADGEGIPVTLTLGAQDAETGTIYLADGTSHSADLIIGADGIQSVIRGVVVPGEVAVRHSGSNAYRFLGWPSDLQDDPEVKSLFESRRGIWCGWQMGKMPQEEDAKFLIWYDIQGGNMLNYALIYSSKDEPISAKGTTQEEIKKSLMKDAEGFPPLIQKVISTGYDVKPWRLVYQDPLRTWVKNRFLLVGDAAHPVHPVMAQGVNASVEDGAALQILLSNIPSHSALPRRLKAFEDMRRPRTAVIQILSTVEAGNEAAVREELKPYLESMGMAEILNKKDSNAFALGYDVWVAAEEAFGRLLEGEGVGKV